MVSRLRERVQKKQTDTLSDIETELKRVFARLEPDNPNAFDHYKKTNIYNTVAEGLARSIKIAVNLKLPLKVFKTMSLDNLTTVIKEQFPDKDSLFTCIREVDKENQNLVSQYSEERIGQYLNIFSRLHSLIAASDEMIPQIYAVREEFERLLQSSKGRMKYREIVGGLNLVDIFFASLENELFFEIELARATENLESLSEIYVDNILDSMMINWSGTQADCRRTLEYLLQENYIKSDFSTDQFISNHFIFNGKKKSKDDVRKFPRGDADGITFTDVDYRLVIPKR
jgi:hypothetical protein